MIGRFSAAVGHAPQLEMRRRPAALSTAVLVVCLLGWAACSRGPDVGDRGGGGSIPDPSASTLGFGYDTPFIVEGIRQPPTVPADVAQVDEEASVIGVSVAGRHRAYLVHAFESMSSHVVNDLVAETPVSVTHCDQTRCTRVFTTDRRGAVIELSTGGWMDNEMSLRFNDVHYAQTSSDIPLADFPFKATTWRQWKAAHPDTDIYVGETDAPRP